MTENATPKTRIPSLSSHQRRAQSVDEYSLQILNENRYEHANSICNEADDQISTEDDDTFTCNSIPRATCRPTRPAYRRTHSAFAPSPKCNFGPKGTLKKVQNNEQIIVIQDPSSQRLLWVSPPNHILIIRKPGPSTLKEFAMLVVKLLRRGFHIYIELADHLNLPSIKASDLKGHSERCIAFNQENDSGKIDLVICLGGDGTLLHVSSIFQKSCPPVLSFSMGSLGFLTPFDFKSHDKILTEVLSGNVAVLLRTRLNCTIVQGRQDKHSSSHTLQPLVATDNNIQLNDNNSSANTNDISHLALNEVVIDRGPNSYLSNLDLYINDRFITKVQGDGLILSTPTGSTAYGMAAGASMVHPNVPAMVICPICPHSLSFRPIVVPAGIELKVKVSEETRLTAWLAVDGRNRHELHQEDSVRITTSVYPVPVICRFDQLGDWFESLADILHWNLRKPQSKLDIDPNEDNEFDENENPSLIPAFESSVDVEI